MELPSELVETHISTLLFLDDRVYKRKKPIRTPFVDFTTVDARARACRTEVDLNRRLAPDVYLGVADVTMDGVAVDHLVVMRRLPPDRRLSALLDGDEAGDQIRHLAHVLAAFHADARRGPEIDAASGPDAVTALWDEGLDQTAELAPGILDADEVAEVADLARSYLAGRRGLIAARVAAGHAVDGHGDLLAEDVFCLDDGPRVLDCLEFSDRFRFGDVLADVAFLAMDLERLGHPELATAFLDRYRELSADAWPDSLAHMWIAYRAHVRAKVTCIKARQLHDEGADVDAAAAASTAREVHALARRHLLAGRVDLVLVGGGPGTGKSTVAGALADRLGAVLVSSDRVRDEIDPRAAPGGADGIDAGRYAPERVAAVYDELLRRAQVALAGGERVVVDASWLDPDRRDDARAAAGRTHAHLVELCCHCPTDVAEERIARRAARGGDPSEATAAVARARAPVATPWVGSIPLDTTAAPDVVLDRVIQPFTRAPGRARLEP